MPHILIVEDEPSTSWALSEGLSDDGFTIDAFSTAEDAWRWLKTGTSDLVISDLKLPGMNGLEFARKLQRGPNAQPVILVTAYGSPEVLDGMSRAGVVDCFAKPFRIDQLRRAVHRALAAVRNGRATAGGVRRVAKTGVTKVRRATTTPRTVIKRRAA